MIAPSFHMNRRIVSFSHVMNDNHPVRKTAVIWLLMLSCLYGVALAIYLPILQSPFRGHEYQTFLVPLSERTLTTYDFLSQWSPLAVKDVKFSRPLLKLLLLIEHRLWGHDPLPYRLLNLLIHVGCGLIAIGVVHLATGRRRWAWLAGLIVVIYPAAVPAVRWVSARGDLIGTFFSLLALWAVFRMMASDRQEPSAWPAVMPAIFVALALSAKELGLANFISLPLAWLLWPGGRRDRRSGLILFSSLSGLLALYFCWRFFLFSGMGGYGMIPGIEEWPKRLMVLLWQTSGAYLIPSPGLRMTSLAILLALIILWGGRSTRRWKRIGVLALLLVIYGFQSILAGIQDSYYAYAPAAILAILLISAMVDSCSARHSRASALVIILLLLMIGLQVNTSARSIMNRAVELEVSERLMAALEEKEGLMEDGERLLLQLVGIDRDTRIRDQSKIINMYLRFLRGPDGPAIRRNPRKLPPNPRVVVWDGINLKINPATADAVRPEYAKRPR